VALLDRHPATTQALESLRLREGSNEEAAARVVGEEPGEES
jgi:hypothetical protein